MSWSIKLFRVKGIDIKVHLTFVLILIWAAYRWSGSTGEGLHGALFGVVATLLLFASVILHELGHSLMALKYGIRVRDISLLPIGGVAQIEEMPEKPVQELAIALAGPLVNFAIVALLVGVGVALQTQALISLPELFQSLGSANWAGMLAYLTTANLALGVFNLIPAYPMDGGRVLRALLAMRLDYRKATSIAVKIGQGLALLLGLWGFTQGSFTLILIAVFVWIGAAQEGKQTEIKGVLHTMTVGQAMTREPQTLLGNAPLSKAVELTLTTSQADFPVMEWGSQRVVGLLTQGDLLRGLQAHGPQARVSQAMHTQFPTITPHAPLYESQQAMSAGRVGAVPVVENDHHLVGILTAADVNEAYRLLSIGPELALTIG